MKLNDAFYLLKEQFHEHKLGHAFLLETNNQEECLNKVLKFIQEINCENTYKEGCNECNRCHLIESKQLPNLVIIRPDGSFIKKEQILSLKKSFQTKPIFSVYNMYIILNAECLNASSANTMLKFLEEPEEGIIGFFITNNKENVIDTIKSRCQLFVSTDSVSKSLDENCKDLAISFVFEVETAHDNALFFCKNSVIPVLDDKQKYISFFQYVFDIYKDIYDSKVENKRNVIQKLTFLLEKDIKYFLKRMNLIVEILNALEYNVNLQFIFDRFILEM